MMMLICQLLFRGQKTSPPKEARTASTPREARAMAALLKFHQKFQSFTLSKSRVKTESVSVLLESLQSSKLAFLELGCSARLAFLEPEDSATLDFLETAVCIQCYRVPGIFRPDSRSEERPLGILRVVVVLLLLLGPKQNW